MFWWNLGSWILDLLYLLNKHSMQRASVICTIFTGLQQVSEKLKTPILQNLEKFWNWVMFSKVIENPRISNYCSLLFKQIHNYLVLAMCYSMLMRPKKVCDPTTSANLVMLVSNFLEIVTTKIFTISHHNHLITLSSPNHFITISLIISSSNQLIINKSTHNKKQ